MSGIAPQRFIIGRSSNIDRSQFNWIANYLRALSNRKRTHLNGKAQSIDATRLFKPPRNNLGNRRGAS